MRKGALLAVARNAEQCFRTVTCQRLLVLSAVSSLEQGHVPDTTCHVLSEPLTSANNQCFQDASRSLSCSRRFRSVLFIKTMRGQICKVDPRLGARTTLTRISRQASAARSGVLDEVQRAHVASVS